MGKLVSLALSHSGVWGRLNGCTGFPHMLSRMPRRPTTEKQADGIRAHAMAAELLTTGALPDDTCSREMRDAVLYYSKDVESILGNYPDGQMFVEQKVTALSIHDRANGIGDFAYYVKHPVSVGGYTHTLFITDFKYGKSAVEVEGNNQMIGYYDGFCTLLNIDGYNDQQLRVVFTIVQPRGWHPDGEIRRWTVRGSDLRNQINIMRAGAHEVITAPKIRSGPQCASCPAIASCISALTTADRLYETATDPLPIELEPHALGARYALVKRGLKLFTDLNTALEATMISTMRSKTTVPGWSVEPKQGNLEWTRPVDEVVKMGKMMGHTLAKPLGAITPTQAIKLGLDANLIKQFSERPGNGFKIVSDELKTKKANKVFKQ